MKIIKPLRLSVMSRPYYKNNTPYLSVSILALVDMQEKPLLRPEPELWQLAQNELSCCNGLIDIAYPKHYAEFLAVGYAYPHTYLCENVCRISITVGDKQKSLIVSGDRQWQGETATNPQEFKAIPVDWSRAYGGASMACNPLGIGAQSNEESHPIPNIEYPNERINSPTQQVTPAGFGPIDFTWPARQQFMGSLYDEQWMQRGASCFAADTDPRLFNMAPQDQQWLNLSALPSSMTYKIENMHPVNPLQVGILPSWKARCFISHILAGKETFSEIEMRHTTVWFLPHLDKILLVYHGECPIEEDDTHDVQMLMPALEDENKPRSLNHYQEVWLKRSDKETGATYAFQEHDLLPKEAIGQWIDTEQAPISDHSLKQNINTRRQSIYQNTEQRLQAVDSPLPEGIKDSPKIDHPTLAQLPVFMEQVKQQANQAQDDAQQQIKNRLNNPQDYQARRPTGSESFHKMCAGLRKQQNGKLGDDQKASLYQLYRLSVQTQNTVPPLDESRKTELREWVITKLAQDRDFSDCDLTGANLAHLDFSGANLTRTMMESADLSYAILDNCTLTQTLLARAQIDHTSFRDSVLDEATIAQADFNHCDFSGATLNKLITDSAQFAGCNFTETNLSNQIFSQVLIADCNLSSASFDNIIFNNTTLKNVNFSSAKFYKSSFIDCDMQLVVFKDAQIQRCSITNCQADDINFNRTALKNCAFTSATSLERACFYQAELTQCNLRQASLNHSDLSFAQLTECDLSEASLQGANLSHLQASNSLFIRSNLERANLKQANLMGSRLQKSYLIGCDLTKANLFRADISQAVIDDTTLMQDAWVTQMKIYPLYKGLG